MALAQSIGDIPSFAPSPRFTLVFGHLFHHQDLLRTEYRDKALLQAKPIGDSFIKAR